jgi:hypothetical protein
MTLSQRGYAKHRKERGLPGGSLAAVQKALTQGRIQAVDGKIDAGLADAAWASNTRVVGKRQPAGDAPSVPAKGGPVRGSLAAVQLAREKIKLERETLDLAVRQGGLVNAAEIHARIFSMGREARDQLQNWPNRIAAIMAAELGVDQNTLTIALQKCIRQFLTELADWATWKG